MEYPAIYRVFNLKQSLFKSSRIVKMILRIGMKLAENLP